MTHQIDPKSTVGELVREQPALSRVFESLGIDYCCGGKRSLSDAAVAKGLDVHNIIEQLAANDAQASNASDATDASNPDAMSLRELADHIEATHHEYLRSELPRLDAITEKVSRVHGDREPRLATVREAFTALRDELTSHMMKEERVLFPIIRALEDGDTNAASVCGSVANPIRQMESEHDDAGSALKTMRTATDDYTPPEWACNTYRAMLDGLQHLERDMHQHVHKENNVLFPRAIEREHQLTTAGAR